MAVVPPKPLDITCDNMKKEWRSFRFGFEFYEYASGLKDDIESFRVINLLTLMGKPAVKILDSLTLNTDQRRTVVGLLDAMDEFFDNGGKVFKIQVRCCCSRGRCK